MIRKRNSKLVAVATAGFLSLAMLGCSSGASEVSPSQTSDEGLTGTLTLADWQFLEPGRGDVLWAAAQEYQKAQPGVTIEKSETPYADYANKLVTELGAGAGPDVFVMLDSTFAPLSEANLLEPLDDVLGDADLNSSNAQGVVDGAQLAVTWEQVPYAFLGNKKVMEAAGITELPTTVDELIEAGKKVEATGADGFAVRHQISELAGWTLDFQNWPYGSGGQWSDGTNLTIDTPENVQGVAEFKRVMKSGIVPLGDDASTFRKKFMEGQLGFIIDNAGAALSLATGGSTTGHDIIAGPLPFPQPGAHQMLFLGVNAQSENKEIAKDFIRWFASEEGQTAFRPGLGASTMATDVPLPDAFKSEHPWAETYLELGATSKSTLIAGHETDTAEIMKIILEAVERSVAEDADPQAMLADAQNRAENR